LITNYRDKIISDCKEFSTSGRVSGPKKREREHLMLGKVFPLFLKEDGG